MGNVLRWRAALPSPPAGQDSPRCVPGRSADVLRGRAADIKARRGERPGGCTTRDPTFPRRLGSTTGSLALLPLAIPMPRRSGGVDCSPRLLIGASTGMALLGCAADPRRGATAAGFGQSLVQHDSNLPPLSQGQGHDNAFLVGFDLRAPRGPSRLSSPACTLQTAGAPPLSWLAKPSPSRSQLGDNTRALQHSFHAPDFPQYLNSDAG